MYSEAICMKRQILFSFLFIFFERIRKVSSIYLLQNLPRLVKVHFYIQQCFFFFFFLVSLMEVFRKLSSAVRNWVSFPSYDLSSRNVIKRTLNMYATQRFIPCALVQSYRIFTVRILDSPGCTISLCVQRRPRSDCAIDELKSPVIKYLFL